MQEKLIGLRKTTNTTQETLAKIIGISPKTYGFKETGKSEFTINEMFRIAQYFDKKVDEIFLPYSLQNGVKEDCEKKNRRKYGY